MATGHGGRRLPTKATLILHTHGVTARDVAREAGATHARAGSRVFSGGRRPDDPEAWARALRSLLPDDAAEGLVADLGLEDA
jgi:hypothetical protein